MPITARLWFELEGMSPLLMHNPASMRATVPGRLGRKVIPTVEAEAAAGRYLLPDGNFYIPAIAVRNSLLAGAKGFRITGTRQAAPRVLAGAIGMGDEVFPLLDGNDDPIPGDHYTIYTARVVIQGQGILRSRPKIDLPWKLRCNFPFNAEMVGVELIKMVLVSSGEVVGIGDYRPAPVKSPYGGWFGKYRPLEVWTAEL